MIKVLKKFCVYHCTKLYINKFTGASLVEVASGAIRRLFSREGFCDFQSRWAFVATWHKVSRYTSSIARDYVGIVIIVT